MSKMARSVASEVGVDIFSVNLYVRKCGAEEMANYFHEVTAPFIEDDKVRLIVKTIRVFLPPISTVSWLFGLCVRN